MRIAGEIPIEIIDLIVSASEDTSQWPSINRPVPPPKPDYKYDEHMKMLVPNMPRRV